MSLTFDIAQTIVSNAVKAGAGQGVNVAVVVVDRAGRVVASGRSEAAGFINLAVAERKAVASASFGAPTLAVLEMVKGDQVLLSSVMGETSLSILPGGMPITLDGQPVGAVGIAGAHYSQDHAIAETVVGRLSQD
ncbi:heme-binding protein [Niveispirillum sp.]|uniref:GlcG/HbpS family heme-binding protein n=1 Tax=Niveispirillum sp. TaxID=1917217 RepID=UPI001B6FDB86|nr:heme-binding protein [Niveispirillum sp.]MBP7337925.1 heme-binding protein [Niveispirillum sp.]